MGLSTEPAVKNFAGYLLLAGLALYLLLSPYLLDSLGYRYIGESGTVFEKLHPGTYCIGLAFILLIGRRSILTAPRAYQALFVYYCVAFLYMVARSAPAGMAFMIDGHITVPVCALILCSLPYAFCRKALALLVSIAIINSVIGLGEALMETRLFSFTENTVFIHEEYFRSSALLGHPLANALFTSVALFVALALPYRPLLKYSASALLLASLVAFGGRTALACSVLFLLFYATLQLITLLRTRSLTLMQLIPLLGLAFLFPFILFGGLYWLLTSPIGERIHALISLNDASAQSRLLAFSAIDYMSEAEIWLGMSLDRIEHITQQMSQHVDLNLIENPWLLMFMHLGALQFTVWLGLTAAFIFQLIRREPLALKLAVIIYFVIASGFNSFAAKSLGYPLMLCFVISTSRILSPQKYAHESSLPPRT